MNIICQLINKIFCQLFISGSHMVLHNTLRSQHQLRKQVKMNNTDSCRQTWNLKYKCFYSVRNWRMCITPNRVTFETYVATSDFESKIVPYRKPHTKGFSKSKFQYGNMQTFRPTIYPSPHPHPTPISSTITLIWQIFSANLVLSIFLLSFSLSSLYLPPSFSLSFALSLCRLSSTLHILQYTV